MLASSTDPPRCPDVGQECEWEPVELRKQRAANALPTRRDQDVERCGRCSTLRIVEVESP